LRLLLHHGHHLTVHHHHLLRLLLTVHHHHLLRLRLLLDWGGGGGGAFSACSVKCEVYVMNQVRPSHSHTKASIYTKLSTCTRVLYTPSSHALTRSRLHSRGHRHGRAGHIIHRHREPLHRRDFTHQKEARKNVAERPHCRSGTHTRNFEVPILKKMVTF
jgi:hypothetical protein